MTSAAFVRIMDRSIIQERLAETKERIANGESQIAQQRRLIAELETNGSPASHAKYLLAGLKLLQTARRDSRDWLLKRLKSVYRRRFQRRGGQFQVPGMGPPFTADAPVDTSTPVAKALAAKQAITDFGNMDPPPSPPFIGKWAELRPCQPDATPASSSGTQTARRSPTSISRMSPGPARGDQAAHARRGATHRRQHHQADGDAEALGSALYFLASWRGG
jgi:hypothetical protein